GHVHLTEAERARSNGDPARAASGPDVDPVLRGLGPGAAHRDVDPPRPATFTHREGEIPPADPTVRDRLEVHDDLAVRPDPPLVAHRARGGAVGQEVLGRALEPAVAVDPQPLPGELLERGR